MKRTKHREKDKQAEARSKQQPIIEQSQGTHYYYMYSVRECSHVYAIIHCSFFSFFHSALSTYSMVSHFSENNAFLLNEQIEWRRIMAKTLLLHIIGYCCHCCLYIFRVIQWPTGSTHHEKKQPT